MRSTDTPVLILFKNAMFNDGLSIYEELVADVEIHRLYVTYMITLPVTGFLLLRQIIGEPNANPPVPAIMPVRKSNWWIGVKTGR
jgi:hypothetical protein